MSLSTVDRHECDHLPPDHTVDAHLEAERQAMAKERAAQEAPADERWRLIRSVGLGLAIAGTIAIGWQQVKANEAKPTTCSAPTTMTVDGTELQRDPSQGCAWVDGNGTVVKVDADGQPTGS